MIFAESQKSRYDLNFTVLNFPVCVNPFFWLIAAVLGWGDNIPLTELIIWILCVFVSILVHELGHAIAARHFGARNIRIVLHGMGGQTVSNANLSQIQRIIELSSGPMAGFLLLSLVFLIHKSFTNLSHNSIFYFATSFLIYINLVWSLFNLIPVLPMDGGQIVRELIKSKRPWDGADIATKISIGLSIIIAILFVILSLIGLVRGSRANFWYPAAIFTILAIMNFQMYKYKYIYDQKERDHGPRNPWERDPDWWKR